MIKTERQSWASLEVQREFLDAMAIKLGIEKGDRSAWYRVSTQQVIDNGGKGLLQRYQFSLSKLLTAVYPDFAWDALKFGSAPRNHWASIDNQRSFMDELAKKLGFGEGEREGWYKVSHQTLLDHGGRQILAHHNDSLPIILAAVYPDYSWNPLKFSRARRNYWLSLDNQRTFLDELAKKLGMKEGDKEQWYKVPNRVIIENGGKALLKRYNDSLHEALKHIYPEFNWMLWKFHFRGRMSDEAVVSIVGETERLLGIKSGREWSRVTLDQLRFHGLLALSRLEVGQLLSALRKKYPGESWTESALLPLKKPTSPSENATSS